jgi:hypothetical protein
MKTAIMITGAMRSFDKCLATQHWHIYRHIPDAEFFVSTVKDADSDKTQALVDRYGADRVHIDVVDAQPDCIAEQRALGVPLPTEWVRGKPYMHEPYAISVHPQVLRQLWQLQHGWEVFGSTLAGFDRVIRCRPDLWFHSCASVCVESRSAKLPWWGRFGGCNDRFAALSIDAAFAYFTTYGAVCELLALGCPLHPESLIAARLETCGITVAHDLACEFSTLRTTGEMRGPEMHTWDLAAYLRGR